MTSNQMNEELFDVILKNAFSDSFNRELDAYEAAATELTDMTPSKEHHKIAHKVYKKKMRRNIGYATILQRTAASILIVFSLWNVVMLCSPSVQAAVVYTIVEFFDKYVSFDFSSKDDNVVVGTHTVGYIPNGYKLIDTITTEGYEKYIFSNGNDNIFLRIMSTGISEVGVDSENRTMRPVEIKDYVAYALLHNDSDESTVVIWGDENCSFTLTANLSLSQLIKIANSLG